MKLRLSDEAQGDLDSIEAYTVSTHGFHQWLVYSGRLEQGFATLRRFPQMGLQRPELPDEYLAFRVGEHWICYQITANEVVVHAIVKYLEWFGR